METHDTEYEITFTPHDITTYRAYLTLRWFNQQEEAFLREEAALRYAEEHKATGCDR